MNSAFGGPGLRDAWPTAASRGLTPASHCSRPSRAQGGEFGVYSGALTSVGFSSHFPAQGERGWTCDQTHCPLNFILQNWAWGLGRLSGLLGFTPMWESPVCGPGPRECTDEDGVGGPSCDTSSLRGGADSRHPWILTPLAGRRKRQLQTPHLAEALRTSENKVAAISNFSVSQESSFQPSWSTAGGGAGVGTDPRPWRWGQAGRREPVS